MGEIDNVPLESVRINGGTQSRVEMNQQTISEYADSIRLAVELPPVVLFFDGVVFWLADGFHRFHAHREAGAMEIAAHIHTGTQRDAILYSVGANASHGLRRSNEDKRKAVETLLGDPEWATWSNNAIAKACSVNDKTVAAYRAEHLRNSEDSQPSSTRTVERSGKTYEQNTANIGPATPRAESADVEPQREAQQPAETQTAASQETRGAEPAPACAIIEQGDAPQAAAPEMGELAQLREQLAEVSADLEKTLADNTDMGRVFDADDRLRAAMDEVKRYKATAASAKQSLDTEMGKTTELIRTVKRLTRDLEKEKKRADSAEQQLAQMRGAA